MQNLVIIGARGSGRGILDLIRQGRIKGDYVVKGFLDDDKKVLDGLIGNFPPILSSVEDYNVDPDDVFFCALGDSQYRKKYAEIIEQKGGAFCSLISKYAYVNKNAVIHNGAFIGDHSMIDDNVFIGKHTAIHPFCIIGHDSFVGDYTSVDSYCFVGGRSKIGNDVSIHVRSTIISHTNIGDRAVVGAGSVVIRDISEGIHVFGVPAKKVFIDNETN